MIAKQKTLLILFEDSVIREESILYAFGLARRLDLPVAFLMLVSDGSNLLQTEEDPVNRLRDLIAREQTEATIETRQGDKTTELLKYLAAKSNPAVIVWGSDRQKFGKFGSKKHHWLNKVSNMLPCSIVSPIPKNKLSEG
ncbi:MAG: hypothetical protein P8Z37_08270 [Acidobacteriota bacterium]